MSEQDTVWIAMCIPYPYTGNMFALIGVFLDESQAVAACRRVNDLVGPVPVGVSFADSEDILWPGAYYPRATEWWMGKEARSG